MIPCRTENEGTEELLSTAFNESCKRQREVLDFLEGSHALLEYHEFKDAAHTIFKTCKRLMGARAGYVALLASDSMGYELLLAEPCELAATFAHVLPEPVLELYESACKSGRAVFLNEPARGLPLEVSAQAKAAVENVLFSPLLISAKPVGMLAFFNKPGGFTECDALLATAFGGFAALSLQKNQIAESLIESEERYRILFNSGNDAMFVHSLTPEGEPATFMEVNEVACQLLEYSRAELLELTSSDIGLDAPEESRDNQTIQASLLKDRHILFDRLLVTKSGRAIPFEINAHLFEFRGRPTVLSIARDITDRKRAEKERMRLLAVIEQVVESVIITDTDWIIRYVNPAFEDISGYGQEEVIGRHISMFRSGKHEEVFYRAMQDTVNSGDVWIGRIISRKKDASLYEVETTVSPLRDCLGNIINFVCVMRDVTHEVQLERQLRQAQKMEAIGTLAGGISHDFNNILASIMGFTEMAIEDLPVESPVRNDLTQVLASIHRAKDLVRQILTFSRRKEQEKKPTDIAMVVREALRLLRASIPTTIEIRRNIPIEGEEDAGLVLADSTQIHQLLMNMGSNAAHAMREKGGVLEVGLSRVYLDSKAVARLADLYPGEYLKLSVSDTGHGIEPEVLHRIFDPFFTTKGPESGTGLGLSVVYGIVKSHGGAITVESEPGSGATFEVFLPRVEGEAAVETEEPQEIVGGSERILFVDDEKSLAEMGKRMLEHLGYRVNCMTSSLEALELFRSDPDRFDLVITDQTMPHMTGIQLAEEVLSIRPDMPIILCTGYSEVATFERVKAAGIRRLLMKPLGARNFGETIRYVLDGREEKNITPCKHPE